MISFQSWLLFFHLLGASVWVGGHLILALSVLPNALKSRSIDDIQKFEAAFERVGIPALLLQVITGVLLVHPLLPDWALWKHWALPATKVAVMKLGLLLTTGLLAIDARLRVIPRLTPDTLGSLAWHIVPVTVIGVLFVWVGWGFRAGLW